MPPKQTAGPLLIREGTALPLGLLIETEAIVPGWRALKSLDSYGFGRQVEGAGWYFFYLAGEMSAVVLGREGPETLRRAILRVAGKLETQEFNSLEVTEIRASRFLGIPYVRYSMHSRQIQKGMALLRAGSTEQANAAAGNAGQVFDRHGDLMATVALPSP